MANRAFELLRRVYSYGIDRDIIPPSASPFHGLKLPAEEESRDRVLSLAELWALNRALDQLPGANSDIVRLILLTASRRGMVIGAKREEFDLNAETWTIPAERMKAGHEHVVPLPKAALTIIRRRLGLATVEFEGSDQLFPAGRWQGRHRRGPTRSLVHSWQDSYVRRLRRRVNEALIAVGLQPAPRWTIHDLRRTAATYLRSPLGVDIATIQMILAHQPSAEMRTTYIYVRAPLLNERRAALNKLADWLEMVPDPRTKVVAFKEEAKR